MDLVTLFALCRLASSAPQAGLAGTPHGQVASIASSAVERWRAEIAEASRRFDLPEPWIEAVMQAESGGKATHDGQPTVSRAGAIGLMQVMPGTYADMRHRLGLGGDPSDPRDNILAGAAYLAEMHRRYGCPDLFAAYNAGPERLESYLRQGKPLPAETLAYLVRIGAITLDAAHATRLSVAVNRVREGNSDTAEDTSGRALFFAIGRGEMHVVGLPRMLSRERTQDEALASVFVSSGDRDASAQSASGGGLFVPLSRDRR